MRKKNTFVVATILIACSSYVNASTDTEITAPKECITLGQKKGGSNSIAPHATDTEITAPKECITLGQKKGGSNCITPPARPDVKDGVNIFLIADALFWVAQEDGLEFAEQIIKNGSPLNNFIDGKVLYPDFDWKWGFRVGLGYNTPHDGWDLCLNWVRFTSSDHNGKEFAYPGTGHDEILLPSNGFDWLNNGTGNSDVQEAETQWNVKLNLLDLELGRDFFVSHWLTFRPFAGLRGAWIEQKLRNHYLANQSTGAPDFSMDIEQGCRFWGLGIRTGMNTLWGFGYGLGIYANVAISLLPGRFHISYDQDGFDFDTGIGHESLDSKDHLNVARAVTDLAFGLRWDRLICDNAYHIAAHVGFEQHHFFGQNQFRNYAYAPDDAPVSRASIGDLSTYGITTGVEFGF